MSVCAQQCNGRVTCGRHGIESRSLLGRVWLLYAFVTIAGTFRDAPPASYPASAVWQGPSLSKGIACDRWFGGFWEGRHWRW
jgi:hypothetical protein